MARDSAEITAHVGRWVRSQTLGTPDVPWPIRALAELVRRRDCNGLGQPIIEPSGLVHSVTIRHYSGSTQRVAKQDLADTNLAIVLEACRWLDGPKSSQPYKLKDIDPMPFLTTNPSPQPTESTYHMSKSSQLINTSPFATVSFIYGAVALDMTEPELLSALARVEADEAELAKVDPTKLSPYTKQRAEAFVKARTAIGVLLDKLPAQPNDFTV